MMFRLKGVAWMAVLAVGLAAAPGAYAAETPRAAEKTVFLLNTSTGAPYANEDKTGFLDLVVAEAFRRIGERGEVPIYTASKRALINANDGIDHGVAMRVKNLEKKYPNLVRVPERIIENDFVAYSRDLNFATTDWATLKPYMVAYINGWVIFERNLVEGQPKTTVKDAPQMFTMLGKKRIDMVLYERWQGLQRAKDTGLTVTVHEPPLASVDMFMYLHKDYAHMAEPLAKALRDMKADGSYQKIFDQTLTPLAR